MLSLLLFSPGYFIAACVDNHLAVYEVRHFINIQSLEVLRWLELDAAWPICPRMLENLRRPRVKEIVADTTSIIEKDGVIDLAFAFWVDVLENYWNGVAGLTRFFYKINRPSIAQLLCCR